MFLAHSCMKNFPKIVEINNATSHEFTYLYIVGSQKSDSETTKQFFELLKANLILSNKPGSNTWLHQLCSKKSQKFVS